MTDITTNTVISIITDLVTTAVGNVSPNDFLSLFGGANNLNVTSLVQYIQGFTDVIPLSTMESVANLTSTTSDTDSYLVAYTPAVNLRINPLDSTSNGGITHPTTRYVAPIGNEPPVTQTGLYGYNKSYTSESGHIKEVDDTPGHERLLDQHNTGTYQEMKASGDHVIKVVGDNYTIVAGAGHVTIQGSALVHIEHDCNLRVGGSVSMIADGGINLATKGDFRVRAKSINFESVTGDISMKSAGNFLSTSVGSFNCKGDSFIHEAAKMYSVKSGQQVAVQASKISFHSTSDIISKADGGQYMSSASGTNILSNDVLNVQSATSLNLKGTNVVLSGTEIDLDGVTKGQATGSATNHAPAATAGTPDQTIAVTESQGAGIGVANNPEDVFMLTDDDDQASMTAIQAGIKNGTIDPASLIPPAASSSDTAGSGNTAPSLLKSTVGDVGSNPSDNIQLSPSFTLGKLSKYAPASAHVVVAQQGLTTSQIVGNLQLLAINSLEIIKKKFPDMQVTSGFRVGTGKSQHEKGQAADMQFASANGNKALYYQYAQWIRDNVPFDQLILEYKNTGTKLPWIHVSFNGPSNRGSILTKYVGGNYGAGLHDLS
jgi:hypothetical protein